jgi:hypothetical protein
MEQLTSDSIRPRQSTTWMALLTRPGRPHQKRVRRKPHVIRKLTVTDGARDQVNHYIPSMLTSVLGSSEVLNSALSLKSEVLK